MNDNVKCDCEGWLKSAEQIFNAQAALTFRVGIQYTGDIFKYCPWCGKDIQLQNEQFNSYKITQCTCGTQAFRDSTGGCSVHGINEFAGNSC